MIKEEIIEEIIATNCYPRKHREWLNLVDNMAYEGAGYVSRAKRTLKAIA